MKIGLLTIYNALNIGAFLQTFAMKTYLESIGCEVDIINNRNRKYKLLSRHPYRLVYNSIMMSNLICSRINHGIVPVKNSSSKYDAIVVGSDEIWNITSKSFTHTPMYFSHGLSAKKLIAYAPSFGQTTLQEVEKSSCVIEGLNRFQYLSARDSNTEYIVNKLTGKDIPLVLDPTFLFGFDDYAIEKSRNELGEYILVYYFPDICSGSDIEAMLKFSKESGLKLVSPGIYHSWCHKCPTIFPLEFPALFSKARYVITNTFHGTVFSTIYNKQFAVLPNTKKKITSLVHDLHLDDRMAKTTEELGDILWAQKPCFTAVNAALSERKNQSITYLQKALTL